MAKLTIDDLKKIKEKTIKKTYIRHGAASIKIIVHMGTCGIAAGAREVMQALLEEMAETDRQDIRVVTSGCIGKCKNEPNVTIETEQTAPIVYQLMDADKIRQVFQKHVLQGEIQTEFALPGI